MKLIKAREIYEKPIGIITLTVVAIVIAAIITYYFGLT